MTNPFINFTKRDWTLWAFSLAVVTISNVFNPRFDLITFIATIVGATALIFAAKGHVISPILLTVFCALYGIVSIRFHYWGELITFVGMCIPLNVMSTISWFRNPSEVAGEVQINRLTKKQKICSGILTVVVTIAFYFILSALNTPNIFFSTMSIATSFAAAAMTILRSSYYAFWYIWNDIVCMTLWILASIKDPVYIPMVVNFGIFFINDIYGFYSWKKREKAMNL